MLLKTQYLMFGDDKVKISKFCFFIVENEWWVFFTRWRNMVQSRALREYLLKMPKIFEIGPLVMENESSKVGRKSENHQKSTAFCQEFHEKPPKCVQNSMKIQKSKIWAPEFKWFFLYYGHDFWWTQPSDNHKWSKFFFFCFFLKFP